MKSDMTDKTKSQTKTLYRNYAVAECLYAEDIKDLRHSLGITQKELATLLRCSKSTVERWEMGDAPITGPLVLLAQLLREYPEYAERIRIPEQSYPLRLWYMFRNTPCTLIDVNEAERKVQIQNFTDRFLFRAFGKVEHPDYAMYEEFLESRCFPESRDKLKLVLQDLDLPFYDPLLIIQKTQGRMAEDEFWIQIETR